MHIFKEHLMLTLGQPMAVGVAGIISGSIGISGRTTYGADICVIVFACMTMIALLVDMYFDRHDRSMKMVSRVIMLLILLALIILGCVQATDVAVNDYSFAAMLVFSLYVLCVTLWAFYVAIRRELLKVG